MALRDVFADAWRDSRGLGSGWIVNLEPTFNLALGAVGVVDGDEFHPESSLELRGITGLQRDLNQKRSDTPWQFQSNDQISIQVDAAVASPGPGGLPVQCNLSVNFGRDAGASIHGTAMWWSGYADLGVVRAEIVDAARTGRLHKGESIVVMQQLTGPGILFTAEGRNASLVAQAAVDPGRGTVPQIGSLAGKLGLVSASAGAQFQSFADGSVLAARVLYLGRRGWLWWRDFEAYGAVGMDRDQIEETVIQPVEGDGDDQYFALVR